MARISLRWPKDQFGHSIERSGPEPLTGRAGRKIGHFEPEPMIVRNSNRPVFYNAMKEVGLCHRLAETETTEEGARAFVNAYGFLRSEEGPEAVEDICDQIRVARSLV